MGNRLNLEKSRSSESFAGSRVLILKGEFKGQEGICLGKGSDDSKKWAISPDSGNRILELIFEKEFGLLIDLSGNPTKN